MEGFQSIGVISFLGTNGVSSPLHTQLLQLLSDNPYSLCLKIFRILTEVFASFISCLFHLHCPLPLHHETLLTIRSLILKILFLLHDIYQVVSPHLY